MFTRATILCAVFGLASATINLINTPTRSDFVRRGQGCCRLVESEFFEWEPPKEIVTNEVGRPMTRAKCLDFCINNRTNCRGIELDTSTSHPKCELQTLNTLFVNDQSRGCTFGSISCHSLRISFEVEEIVEQIVEEIVDEDCIAGNEILTTQSGLMQADQVQVGMQVLGMSGADATERWCEVLKVVDHGVGSVIDGFTHNHLVLDADLNIKPNYKLEYTDMNKTRSDAHLVNIFTDCEAVTTTAGASFTPFSTTFCNVGEMSWDQYRAVYNGVMSIVTASDGSILTELMDPKTYHNNASNPYGNRFMSTLPGMCIAIAECAASDSTDNEKCHELDSRVAALLANNLDETSPISTLLQSQMPVSSVVVGSSKSYTLEIVIGSCVAVLAVVGIVGVAIRRRSSALISPTPVTSPVDTTTV